MFRKFPEIKQLDQKDCGPTCLKIIAKYYGKFINLNFLRKLCGINKEGVSLLGISDAAESIGFRTIAAKIDFDRLKKDAVLPCIVYWKQEHFVVVYGFKKNNVLISDPAFGLIKYSKKEFIDNWSSSSNNEGNRLGIVLLLEPTPKFYEENEESSKDKGINFFLKYLRPYKNLMLQLFIGVIVASILQLILPFLTQAIVDIGIQNQDLNFISLLLIAQLMVFAGRTSVDFIRSWILLHLGTRINVAIISDFLAKLMRLPVSFFDSKRIGDLLERIGDHRRIEVFLTSSALNIIFSVINLIVFGIVLLIYKFEIFLVFLAGSTLFVGWILIFLKKRRQLDYKQFDQRSRNQSSLIQLINGIQEIKLHNNEKQRRWEWERIQAKLFKVNIKGLTLDQYQEAGSSFINELKNIIITFFSAYYVIQGEITLGMMIAIQYIIGQLNSPLLQFINILHLYQDAKISVERLTEIHDEKEEMEHSKTDIYPKDGSLILDNVFFKYNQAESNFTLKDINFTIPAGKTIAIVGASGSGKTTLLKLLLKFYKIEKGNIKIGEQNLNKFSNQSWREKCGAVLQDGYIFSESILKNITLDDENVDIDRFHKSINISNLQDFIDKLPDGYYTNIGSEGNGISQGQKQRILIARAIYKDPDYLFFDEATNALDAKNEKSIVNNLQSFYKGKTVIIVAHRLSTVKEADKIIVLDNGGIVEIGNHSSLTSKKGYYYELVKNQLELGN